MLQSNSHFSVQLTIPFKLSNFEVSTAFSFKPGIYRTTRVRMRSCSPEFGLIFLLYTMFVWWQDVLHESTFEGRHTKVVELDSRYDFIIFIVLEIIHVMTLF